MIFKKILDSILSCNSVNNNLVLKKIARKIIGSDLLYINHDLTKEQRRILISYVSPLHVDFLKDKVYHSLYYTVNQIISVFIDMGFSIDICDCNDKNAITRLEGNYYDYIFGFGKVYLELVKRNRCKSSILFVTENNPSVVEVKYNERISYFKKRHPEISVRSSIKRIGYFNMEQFEVSDYGIVLSSHYNAKTMASYFDKMFTINVNGLYNPNYIYKRCHIEQNRMHFLWFGSQGVIHKGLDILIDAFRTMPDCILNIYGVPQQEMKIVQPLLSSNIFVHKTCNVMSDNFLTEVVGENVFVVSASCSEGMMSGIATCMLHGIIPIVTKETGYESSSCIFEFEDYTVEKIQEAIREVNSLSLKDIYKLSQECFEYAHRQFTLEAFRKRFVEIVTELEK